MPKNQKLKVAFLYDDSLDGSEGVANQVKVLGGWLSSRGHQVSYMVGETKITNWQNAKVYSLAKNIKVRFNGNHLSIPLLASRRAALSALRNEQPDVLHVQMPHSPFLSQRVINIAPKIAKVGTFHIYPANRFVRFASWFLKVSYLGGLSKINEVVSVSSAAQSFAKKSFNLKSTIIPNMVDIDEFRSKTSKNTMNEIVFLGRLVERKGCRYLIEAFSLVNKEIPDSTLVIGGDGPQRPELEALVEKLSLNDSVKFMGYVSDEQRVQLLSEAQIACFPSLFGESFGIVLIEAMAAGSGVVLGGNNEGYSSVFSSMPEALFNPRDTNQIASRIMHYLNDKNSANSLHKSQAELVKTFDVHAIGPQIEALYKRAIDKSAKQRHN